MTVEIEPSLNRERPFWRRRASVRGALTLLAGGSVLAACGRPQPEQRRSPDRDTNARLHRDHSEPRLHQWPRYRLRPGDDPEWAGSTFVRP